MNEEEHSIDGDIENAEDYQYYGDMSAKQAEIAAYESAASNLPKLNAAAGMTDKWANEDAKLRDAALAQFAGYPLVQARMALEWDERRQRTMRDMQKYESAQRNAASRVSEAEYLKQSQASAVKRIMVGNQALKTESDTVAKTMNASIDAQVNDIKRQTDAGAAEAKAANDYAKLEQIVRTGGDSIGEVKVASEIRGADYNEGVEKSMSGNIVQVLTEEMGALYKRRMRAHLAETGDELYARQLTEEDCRKWTKGVVKQVVEDGDDIRVAAVLDDMKSREKEGTLNSVYDKDGKVVPGKFRFDTSFYWTTDDRKELRQLCSAAAQKRIRDAKAAASVNENAEMVAVANDFTTGLAVLSSTDNSYDPNKLNSVILSLMAKAMSTQSHKVADHANSLISQLQSRASGMTRRQKNWDEADSKLKTKAEYYRALEMLERQGNVASIVKKVKSGVKIPELYGVDIWQRKISLVKNGMDRGKIPQEEGKRLIEEYRANFGKDNWEEASKFLGQYQSKIGGGTLTVDTDASWGRYVLDKAKKNETGEDVALRLGYYSTSGEGDEGLAKQAMFNGDGSWENGKLSNAKYYMYRYERDDKTILLSGDDMQKLADAVGKFQKRNKNPTPEMVDAMLTSVFSDIMTSRIIWGSENANPNNIEIFRGSYGQVAEDYITRYYSGVDNGIDQYAGLDESDFKTRKDYDDYVKARGGMATRMPIHRVREDFDAELKHQANADLSGNFADL